MSYQLLDLLKDMPFKSEKQKKNKVVKKAKKNSYNFAKAEKRLGVTY